VFDLVHQLGQALDVKCRQIRNAERNEERLEALADEIRFVTFARGQFGHPRAGVCLQCDETVALQQPKRISNRLPTRPKSFRDVFLNDSFAGSERPVEDFRSQRFG
jgi:hypothetical protein